MVSEDYDYWLLDLDGTLVDVEASYTHGIFDQVGDRIGYDFTPKETEALWHGLGGFRNDQLERWGIDTGAFWEAFHEVEDPVARAEATYLYDDAERFAEVERPLGLVTHCQQYLTEPVLDHVDIRDWFDTVVCCTEETGWKPDPGPIELALADIDADGRGALAGDGPHDVGAAWNAGLDGIHVERHGHDRRGMCVLGDYRIETFDDLFERTAAAGD